MLEACPPLAPVEMPLEQARGLVLAADVVAGEQVPPFANTAVDGYAVRAADVADAPVELAVVGEVAAGAQHRPRVGPGEAIRIMTGAPMPAGADAVVMVEDSELLAPTGCAWRGAVQPGASVRAAGDDIQAGDLLFTAGTEIRPAVAGVLASVNARTVTVHPRATRGRAVDRRRARRRRLAAAARADPREQRDDARRAARRGRLRRRSTSASSATTRPSSTVLRERPPATCDAIVTSGGVSMGDYDVVKAVLGRIAEMHWMQIAIKPAKPFAFGLLAGTPVFGLPGNPVARWSLRALRPPGVRRMMGHRPDRQDRAWSG